MRQHEQDETGVDLEAELTELFAREGADRPEATVLQQWVDEDQADFDRAMLISQLVSRSQRRVEPAPVAVAERPREPARTESPAPPPRKSRQGGSPSVTDLLDGMFAQQSGR